MGGCGSKNSFVDHEGDDGDAVTLHPSSPSSPKSPSKVRSALSAAGGKIRASISNHSSPTNGEASPSRTSFSEQITDIVARVGKTPAMKKEVLRFLKDVKLFHGLQEDQMEICARNFTHHTLKDGKSIIKQGDKGDAFFLIRSGVVKVWVTDATTGLAKHVADLEAGDHFGEAALLNDAPRNATVVASENVELYQITRERFQWLGLHENLHFPKRNAVGGAGCAGMVATQPPSPKTSEQREFIATCIRNNKSLSMLVELTDTVVDRMVDTMWTQNVTAEEIVIQEGDAMADYFYIVDSGSFAVTRAEEAEEDDKFTKATASTMRLRKSVSFGEATTGTWSTGNSLLSTLERGKSFGEVALLYNAPRNASVSASEDSVVWVMDRINFQQILQLCREERRKDYARYLDQMKSLVFLCAEEKVAVAQTFEEFIFYKDDLIFRKGDKRNYMMIVLHGEVNIEGRTIMKERSSLHSSEQASCWSCLPCRPRDESGSQRWSLMKTGVGASDRNPGCLFLGEEAIFADEEVLSSVTVSSDEVHCLMLKRAAFEFLLRMPLLELKQYRESNGNNEERRGSTQSQLLTDAEGMTKLMSTSSTNCGKGVGILQKDLKVLGLLGCGGFGYVELVKHRPTGNTFAMKRVSKGFIVKTQTQSCIMTEKQILMMLNSDFIVKLYQSYNEDDSLCFLLEVAMGGELHCIYMRHSLYGSITHAKFYLAGVILGFEHCHSLNVLYRDLKPENLLLNEKGQLKITDLGLAKQVIGLTYTTCGTPEYFAPEVIRHTGQTCAVDWWCLGILLYELLAGKSPFGGDSAIKSYRRILDGITPSTFEESVFSREPLAKEVIVSLLQPDPHARLPMRHGGSSNLKQHAFYQGFDWEAMADLSMKSPYQPKVKSKKDSKGALSQFDALEAHKPKMEPYSPDGTDWDADFACTNMLPPDML